MKNRFVFCFIIALTLLLTLSTVSASENVTDDSIADLEDESAPVIYESDIDSVSLEVNNVQNEHKSKSAFSAADVESFEDLDDKFVVTLVSNYTPLANREVQVVLNGVTSNYTTNDAGRIAVSFKLKAGTYNATFYFSGDDEHASCNGTNKITVKPEIITSIIVADKFVNFREGLRTVFQLRLLDVNSNPIAGKWIRVKVAGRMFTLKTNANGYVTLYLSLKKGTYNILYSFSKNGKYLSSSGTYRVVVKPKLTRGYGYWVNKWSMEKVNLYRLSKLGTKHIFLQHTAFSKYGTKKVLIWINKAHKYGMKVHIWMAVFYKDGKYVHASDEQGRYNYGRMNQVIDQAKYYASLKGVDGIHFDYLRFGGNAYKFKNSAAAINYFVRLSSKTLRDVKPNIVLSAAVMPEPDCMKHYYGQDIPTISKYLDVVVPMAYKGNYHASSSWIAKVTLKLVKQSRGSQIWTGLQTYKSDADITKLSYKELLKDAKAAKQGRASGIVLFRWGLTELLNFKKV